LKLELRLEQCDVDARGGTLGAAAAAARLPPTPAGGVKASSRRAGRRTAFEARGRASMESAGREDEAESDASDA